MKLKSQERGQALIIIALAAVGLFGFTALAIDGSRIFSDRRHGQNAADTAVLAAALAKIREQDDTAKFPAAVAAAQARATSNGFTSGGDTLVEVHQCDEVGLNPPCEGLPADADTAEEKAEYIQVVIRFKTRTTFARIINRTEVPSVVSAIARTQDSEGTTSAFTDMAMVGTRGGPYDQCFLLNGGAVVYTHGSGIFVNCSGAQALFLNGGASLDMDSNGQVVGCDYTGNSAHLDPTLCGANGGVSQTINASTFASVPTKQNPPACGPPATAPINNVYSAGTYTSITINGSATMNPGVYCVTGPFSFNGSAAALSGSTGRVQIVLLQNQNVNWGNLNFTDLEIYGNDGLHLLNAGINFHADRLRYFFTGTGTITVNGNAGLSSGNAYFYLHRGNLNWNGQANLDLHGPPQGDPYGGLLIHKPWENTSTVQLNGGANISLTGTFMVPGSPVIYNGNVDFVLHSQIIGSTFTINGGARLDIYYVPSENYQAPDNPIIQLTK
jgi:hypothetical protein